MWTDWCKFCGSGGNEGAERGNVGDMGKGKVFTGVVDQESYETSFKEAR